jgi:hypothetical protein
MLEVVSPGKRSGYSLCKCECGKIKEISNQNLKTGQKSCGCVKIHNFDGVARAKGEQHGRWRGGISSERERLMQTRKYSDWRRGVFEKDNFTCSKCGQWGGKLQAHHIESFAQNTEQRLNIENGQTFCQSCHFLFHKIFGRKETNMEQIQEFLTTPIDTHLIDL